MKPYIARPGLRIITLAGISFVIAFGLMLLTNAFSSPFSEDCALYAGEGPQACEINNQAVRTFLMLVMLALITYGLGLLVYWLSVSIWRWWRGAPRLLAKPKLVRWQAGWVALVISISMIALSTYASMVSDTNVLLQDWLVHGYLLVGTVLAPLVLATWNVNYLLCRRQPGNQP